MTATTCAPGGLQHDKWATGAPFEQHAADLKRLAQLGRGRMLAPRAGIDFASNDYLALARSPELADAVRDALERGVSVGSGGSRLLRGNDPEHEMLEAEAASFFRTETALFFGSGYAANAVMFATLPQSGDLILHDALIHASAHDGMRLGRAECRKIGHNEVGAFADAIDAWRRSGGKGRPWIAVESLYSMDGDRAPLDDVFAVAERHDAVLLIDEAHATGVFGPDGRGLAAHLDGRANVITLRTCGKAMGCEGALLCGPAAMRDFLVNRGRAFIFSTAPSPLMASTARAALRILVNQPQRQVQLHSLMREAERLLAPLGAMATGSQILPLIVGDDARVMKLARSIQKAGFDVRGIRPPTVPAGSARLRISITNNVTSADIRQLAAILEEVR